MRTSRYSIPTPLLLIVACAAVLLSSCSVRKKLIRQKIEKDTGIDFTVFNRNLRTAQNLALDDRIAWASTDSILAQKISLLDSLDSTWFVCEHDDQRFAYYGRYSEDENRYIPKYTFVSTDDSTITKLPAEENPEATFYAKMVTTGNRHFRSIVDSLQLDIHYNHYIRKTGGGNCTMWFFPAGYGNYCAQGIEVRITIDSASGTVSGHYVKGSLLRYFELDKPARPVELDNSWSATPSVGNLFFVLRNRDNFDTIRIRNSRSTSTLEYTGEGTWRWVHTPL